MSDQARTSFGERARGFTLLELLVVLVLIGIMLSFVTLSTGRDAGADRLEHEARRLSAVLSLAREEAIMRSQELALTVTRDGYRFLAMENDGRESGWRVIDDDRVLRARGLPDDVEIELSIEGRPVVIEDTADDDDAPDPQVMILSSGELTRFELTMRLADADPDRDPYTLNAYANGQVRLQGPGVDGGGQDTSDAMARAG